MMLTNPTRDFFIKAATIAKQNRISELNILEAELIMLDEDLIKIQSQGFVDKKISKLSLQIEELKKIIRAKKKEI